MNQSRRTRATVTCAIAVLASGAFVLAALRSRVPSAHAGAGSQATVGEAPSAARAPAPTTAADEPRPPREAAPVLRKLPSSLEGTRPDGDLETDGAGHLVVSAQTKRFFDYFLLASGQEPDSSIRDRVDAVVAARGNAALRDETMALFDRYGVYRAEAKRLVAPMQATTSDYELRISALRALRRRVLGPGPAAAFFADDEELEDLQRAYGRREGAAAPQTSSPLAESPAAVLARDRAWREMPNEARQRARTEALGPEAAARLAALDDEDDAWATRMRIYRAARAALTARGARETFAADVRALRAELFTAEERVRVEALDRIEVQTPRR